MDIVFLQRVVEGAGEGSVEDCRSEREGYDEEGTDGADNRGGQTAQAGEEREETDEDFDDGGDEGDDVGDEHPFRSRLVGIQSVAKFFAEELVDTSVVQTPDLHGIEPELVLMWRAERNVVGHTAIVVLGEVAGAVIPQANVIEVLDTES